MKVPPLMDVPENLRNASVSITADRGSGTGFFVDGEVILTASHVVKSGLSDDQPAAAAAIGVTWTDPGSKVRHRLAVTEVLAYVRSSTGGASPIPDWPDIALLKVSGPVLHAAVRPTVVTLATERSVRPGERLLSYGYPVTNVVGRPQEWKAKGVDEWDRIVLGDDFADPGLSGAPVYSSNARAVVGFITHGAEDRLRPQASVVSIATAQSMCAPLQQLVQRQKPLQVRLKDTTRLPRSLHGIAEQLASDLSHRPWGIQMLHVEKASRAAVLLLRVMDKDFQRITGQTMSVVDKGHLKSEVHYYSSHERHRAQSDAVPWAVLRVPKLGCVEFVGESVRKKRRQSVVHAHDWTFPFVVVRDGAGVFYIGSGSQTKGTDPTIHCFVKTG